MKLLKQTDLSTGMQASKGQTQSARWDQSNKGMLRVNDWNTTECLIEALQRKKLCMKAVRGSFRNGSSFDGKQGPENAKLLQPNECSWTALILQRIKSGHGRQALSMFEQMRKEGVEPSSRTLIALLKVCSGLKDPESANRIHAEVVRSGLESNINVGTMLVDMYANCKSLVEARHAFERLPYRDVVSWTAMISGYAKVGKGGEALQLFAQMQQQGVVPDGQTYLSALKACSSLAELGEKNKVGGKALKQQCLKTVRAIHRDIVAGNFKSGMFLGTMLVDVYAKCGSLQDARCVFENMPHRDVVSWNALILGYAQMKQGEDALQMYTRMLMEGVKPDDRTYVSALKACSSLAGSGERNGGDGMCVKRRCLESVKAIHANVRKGKFESNVFVGNMLVDAYGKCGSLEDARCVFEKMPHRSVVSWTAIIFGYAQRDEGEVALQLYTRMQQEGVVPNDRTYVSALKACSCLAEVEERNEGNCTVAKERCLDTVRSIHREVVKWRFESDVFVATMLVVAYAKWGNLEEAMHVFEKLRHRDTVSWNAILLGYVKMDKGGDALQLYAQMQQEGVEADNLTYVAAIKACGTVAALEKGKKIHAQILKAGHEDSDSFVANSLIHMYGKCGSMVDAQQVFDTLATRNIVSWSALIAGYAQQGNSGLCFDLFDRMKQAGIQPDGITFLGLLTVCSHVGLVDRGQQYFEAMSRDYGIMPTLKHFTCVVDLLCRSGHVDKAIEIVNVMPLQPDTVLWECTLSACRKWVDVGLGRQAFECAVRLDKGQAAAYNLMSSIYAAAHMWEEANEIRAMRENSRAWKQPGWSRWTDMCGVAYMFLVGDQEHAESLDLYAKLGDLLIKMRDQGYVPHLDSVSRAIPDDENEGSRAATEKLAFAYSLLKAPKAFQVDCVESSAVQENRQASACSSLSWSGGCC